MPPRLHRRYRGNVVHALPPGYENRTESTRTSALCGVFVDVGTVTAPVRDDFNEAVATWRPYVYRRSRRRRRYPGSRFGRRLLREARRESLDRRVCRRCRARVRELTHPRWRPPAD
ncbi:hypothetical protein B4N89_44955 [Embleya scabrispora]|uniref:Uncharacterized protein n=1 Tax=Embleya scabrispora TaxID=159449 RepID=A0A1T3NIU1_9ACTN|nr:hypothetical protein B4N89_44955 [Embleya scabrispora]